MPEIEITCQYVDHAKTGKKYGSIKSSEGQKYLVKAAMVGQFARGQVCKISYHNETWGQDTVNVVDSKLGGGPVPPPTPNFRNKTDPKDSEQIFVIALLKEMVTPDDTQATVIAKTNMLKAAYRNTFGTPEKQTTEAILNDSIPDEF